MLCNLTNKLYSMQAVLYKLRVQVSMYYKQKGDASL